MALRSIAQVTDLHNKRALVRVDFNVPIEKKRVLDDTRLEASIPTIEHLRDAGAKVMLLTHVGRPEGKKVGSLKTDPIADRLGQLMHTSVKKIDGIVGKKVEQAIDQMKVGDIIMLENVRFSPDEEKNRGTLAMDLAKMADIFVLDGFAVAHRASATVVGLAEHLPSYAGLLLHREIEGLSKVFRKPEKPVVAIIGGAKAETKIPVIDQMLRKADTILVGGGVVNTMLKARGYGVGSSIVGDTVLDIALTYTKKKKIIQPLDLVVGDIHGRQYRIVEIGKEPHELCKRGEAIFDLGPKTVERYAPYIKKGMTVVWNGAMGYFEQSPYDMSTRAIARLVASVSKGPAYGVIGGGETIQAMELVGMSEFVDLVSTGGGAMLQFLSGEELPGIVALGG